MPLGLLTIKRVPSLITVSVTHCFIKRLRSKRFIVHLFFLFCNGRRRNRSDVAISLFLLSIQSNLSDVVRFLICRWCKGSFLTLIVNVKQIGRIEDHVRGAPFRVIFSRQSCFITFIINLANSCKRITLKYKKKNVMFYR